MQQDIVILGLALKEYMPYFFMLLVGFCVGGLFVLRTIKNEVFSGKWDKIRYIFWGIGSSMLTTWISFEAIIYFFHLPIGLSTAIAGGIGYIGAEVVSDYALKILEKKIGDKK
ncbi:hypothetical protein HBZC1_17600 [Helicobacter bizzozeronii CIII-1]|uniref:Holin n=1 Tax=Helicobacter bizzozeronii (strain CIII-1) TaxID=1002804 RepID=F8KPM1_HELBC|nr:phage holin family protein [Helicobacter bizzozeronii]GMB93901.1 holin [Helicobacter bizzozeronii]GMT38536.1 holin [Helicobacter bizzozeronii]CCB80746.1 hypothetical protein HBZC1_17600 [Helicobacter bizzozeronii CIII-1]